MKITYLKMEELIKAIQDIQNIQMPFQLSLILARNLAKLQEEEKFYIEQERKFVQDYLVFNEDGTLKTSAPNVFEIQDGKEKECAEARKALDSFEIDIDLKLLKEKDLGKLDLTPAQVSGIIDLIELEEE